MIVRDAPDDGMSVPVIPVSPSWILQHASPGFLLDLSWALEDDDEQRMMPIPARLLMLARDVAAQAGLSPDTLLRVGLVAGLGATADAQMGATGWHDELCGPAGADHVMLVPSEMADDLLARPEHPLAWLAQPRTLRAVEQAPLVVSGRLASAVIEVAASEAMAPAVFVAMSTLAAVGAESGIMRAWIGPTNSSDAWEGQWQS